MTAATPLDRLDWDDLRVFLHAVRQKSVTSAARKLGISHSTVSRRISRLEYAVGAALFERNRDGLVLTGSGASVLKRAEELEAAILSLRSDLIGGDRLTGTVRLATMEGIATLYLSPKLARLTETYPQLHVELLTSAQTVRVGRREADIFLSFFRPSGTGLVSIRVGVFATGLYASASYLGRRGVPENTQDLQRHRFVGYIEDFVQIDAVRWLNELVKDPVVGFTSNSMLAQMAAARDGWGVACLPAFAVEAHSGLVRILPELRGQRELWLSVHQDMQNVPRVRMVTRYIRETIQADEKIFVGA
jgi:DNA-binding transcriptional LysR family regulator